MRSILLLLALGALAACSNSATTSPATQPGPAAGEEPHGAPTAAVGPALSADGKHFAAEARFQGECTPAGGRGGCYVLNFHPDGSAHHLLLDATESGTYRIEGKAIIYKSTLPEAQEQRFESTDEFRTLGKDYRYTP